MGSLLQDLRYARRALAKTPGFTATVIATLALAIGANSAIFAVVDAALLRPLPFRDSERLVRVRDVQRLSGAATRAINTSPENFLALRDSGIFEDVVAQDFRRYNLSQGDRPEQVRGVGVSAGWLAFLGVRPVIGRDFLPEEAAAAGPVALIGDRLWNERFGGDGSALGASILLDGRSFTVVGVLPRWMNFPYDADLWIPGRFDAADRTHRLNVFGRLRPGVSLAALPSSFSGLASRLAAADPATHAGWKFAAIPLRDELVEDRAKIVLVLLAAVALLLAIACTNLAGMLLARAAGRETELAIRRALGAGIARQIRPAVLESVILTAAGAGAGILLAVWTRGLLASLTAPLAHDLAAFAELGLSPRVVAYTAGLSALAMLLLAAAPAVRLFRTSSAGAGLLGVRATAGAGHRRLLSTTTVAEIALVFLMLQAAGVLAANASRLANRDLGFDRANLLTMRFFLAGPRQGALLSSLVAGFALLLAGLGIHGVLSYAVRMRRREFGVRIALGASPSSILRLVASDGSRLSAAGAILGAAAFLASRGLLLKTLDAAGAGAPLSTAGVWITALPLLAFAVLAACVLPARRAIRVDPVEALRSE